MTNIKLKELRKKHGETQADIAKLLGLRTASAYNKKENGNVPLSLEEVIILANHYKQPIEYFVNEFSQ